jgi:hypothetical protein
LSKDFSAEQFKQFLFPARAGFSTREFPLRRWLLVL